MTENIGPELGRLESRQVEGDQASVVSVVSGTFRTYVEARTELGSIMTPAYLEDEVTLCVAQ